jgi:hypothetical protein
MKEAGLVYKVLVDFLSYGFSPPSLSLSFSSCFLVLDSVGHDEVS